MDVGPAASGAARAEIQDAVSGAVDAGARVLARAPAPEGDGYFVSPTVLEVGTEHAIWREEVFGPVLALAVARDEEHALALANDSAFGLSAAVFTQDVARTLRVIDELDVGVVHLNSESAGADPHVPFGGTKDSGIGPKEQGRASREFFTTTTTAYLR
jgi:aldehyde dehydrogenase (NAD+)